MFKFQNSVTYEQLSLFAKDIFVFSGRLPTYESNGLIKHLRNLASTAIQDYAEGTIRPSKFGATSLERCIVTIAKISTVIDLCHLLGYIDKPTHEKGLWSCNDMVKRLYEAQKS